MDTLTLQQQDGVTFGEPLAPGDSIMLSAPGYRLSALGLQVTKPDLSWDEYAAMGQQLQFVEGGIRWWVADWINYGKSHWGDKYTQAILVTGNKLQTLMNWAWIARAVPYGRRRALSMTHHSFVAKMEPEDQSYWLDRAVREDWSTAEMRAAIQEWELSRARNITPTPEPVALGAPESERVADGFTNSSPLSEMAAPDDDSFGEDREMPGEVQISRQREKLEIGPDRKRVIDLLWDACDFLGLPYEKNNESNLQQAYDLIIKALRLLGEKV